MRKSLLDTFSSLEQGLKDTLADLDSPLLLSFATLDIAANKCNTERLSAEQITACLEMTGVAVAKKSISRALARAGNRVTTSRDEHGETFYKLMTKGKREIAELLGGVSMSIVRIDSGRPRTARIQLGELLSKMRGTIRICDPYYGVRTLDSLDHIPKPCRVKFLTAKTSEAGRKLQSAIGDFKKERPNVEFRITESPNELHDRYVISSNSLLILGHGLKDIGGKESFVINLDKTLVPDLINDILSTFDGRWAKAKKI